MRDFVITTDYTADMPESFYEETGIARVVLPFYVGEKEYDGRDAKISVADFYAAMSEGVEVKTSQASQYDAENIFSSYLEEGKDILHLSFSSGLSSSYENYGATVRELEKKYSGSRIIVIDSLCGANALGLMVQDAENMRREGKSIDEIAAWLEKNKLRYHHYFMVGDLAHLKRGGRISKIEAMLGMALGIKPVLALDVHGKIKAQAKLRGVKKAISAMVDLVKDNIDADTKVIGVGHCGCFDKAEILAAKIKEELDVDIIYTDVSYLIGAHTGPDTIAVFFRGKVRED